MADHFNPHRGDDHPCIECEHWGGLDTSGSHAVCVRGPGFNVMGQSERGCVHWVRATGADDDLEVRRNTDVNLYKARRA